jgi:glycosyltransferase involved in cell wall biosynthesis
MVVSPSIFPGVTGDSANYSELVEEFARKGLEVLLVCPWSQDGKAFDLDMGTKGIRVVRIPIRPPRLTELNAQGTRGSFILRLLVFYIVEIAVVLHTSLTRKPRSCMIRHAIQTLPLAPLLRMLQIRSVADGEVLSRFQDDVLPVPKYMLRLLHKVENLRLYDFFKVSTKAQERLLLEMGFPNNRIILAEIGLDISKIPRQNLLDIPPFSFGYYGLLEKWQGVDLLIRSFARVVQNNRSAKLYIIGDGSMRKKLEEESRDLEMDKNIVFCGAVPRAVLWNTWFRKFRIVVIPRPVSLGAGYYLPIKFVEAIAAGKPVIATAAESLKEVSGRAMILVPQNDEEALASAMLSLCKNDALSVEMSKSALELSHRFGISKPVQKLLRSIGIYAA